VVAYYSKILSKDEKNYCATQFGVIGYCEDRTFLQLTVWTKIPLAH
jgi:hypothetical protein